jgi:pyruvate/2-oxoglutarate dehydrogenase complex dihydrolipoamide dehydrogenase (E3) component
VAPVEQAAEGGDAGVISGTVPSKTLCETALALSGWRSRKLFGVDLSLRREATVVDFTRHQQQVSAGESRRLAARMESLSVERFHGQASFIDAHTVRVAGGDVPECQLRGEEICAAGDVIGAPALAATSMEQARFGPCAMPSPSGPRPNSRRCCRRAFTPFRKSVWSGRRSKR